MKNINYADPKRNLKWFKSFTKICVKYKIWYSVLGGTMIGTIREKGPIPWDDDYDVIMKPEGYEKLKKLFPNNCLDGLSFKNYPLIYPKFVPKFTNLLKTAIYVDIFIIYPTTERRLKKLSSPLNKIRAGMTFIHSIIKFRGIKLKAIKYFTFFLRPFIKKINYKMVNNILMEKENFDFYYIPTTPWSIKKEYIMNKGMTFKTISMKFSDFSVEVMKEYEEHLVKSFGDYMTPVKDDIQHINTFEMNQ